MDYLFRYRRVAIVAIHLALITLSNYLSFFLRFDGAIPSFWWDVFVRNLVWVVAIRALVFVPFRLYEGLWRYSSIWDLRNIIVAVVTSSVVFAFAVKVIWNEPYPRSAFIVDGLLLVVLLGGVRLARRLYRELDRLDKARRVLIYGAGDAGELIVRDMKSNRFYNLEPIGFLDDDVSKVGLSIHGVRVLGTRDDLAAVMARKAPGAVLVAITRAEPAQLRGLVRALEPYKVPIKILPNMRDLLGGRVSVNKIRDLSIEDLLTRAPVDLDPQPVRRLIAGRRVLVTGAGGSIGSELCRQVASYQPELLIFCERYENGLFAIAHDFDSRVPEVSYHAALVDVTDEARVDAVMARFQPHVVFHAAAHKHVYLMELNACEAVKNNVTGTRVVAEAADRHAVQQFVLISTDKAVNPTSVMGASKRVAELLVQSLADRSKTEFVTVRFGNVLGSTGSVSEIFKRQIENGGPITVTHKDARRYFMLVGEAVQLVLHAAARGGTRSVYVLDMGEQVSVLELARNLIRLYGLTPDVDIPIQFIGLRPGEKLIEELAGVGETMVESLPAGVCRMQPDHRIAREFFERLLTRLESAGRAGDAAEVLRVLSALVPYTPAVPSVSVGSSGSAVAGN